MIWCRWNRRVIFIMMSQRMFRNRPRRGTGTRSYEMRTNSLSAGKGTTRLPVSEDFLIAFILIAAICGHVLVTPLLYRSVSWPRWGIFSQAGIPRAEQSLSSGYQAVILRHALLEGPGREQANGLSKITACTIALSQYFNPPYAGWRYIWTGAFY